MPSNAFVSKTDYSGCSIMYKLELLNRQTRSTRKNLVKSFYIVSVFHMNSCGYLMPTVADFSGAVLQITKYHIYNHQVKIYSYYNSIQLHRLNTTL